MVAYVFGDYILFKCILISTGLFQLCSFLPVEICLWSLRFAVPAGNNKLQTCFLSSNPTFAAPSLWHRPYHYPLKQQKCFCKLGGGGTSPAVACLPPLSAISVASADCTKTEKKNPHLRWMRWCFLREGEERVSRIHMQLTANLRLVERTRVHVFV